MCCRVVSLPACPALLSAGAEELEAAQESLRSTLGVRLWQKERELEDPLQTGKPAGQVAKQKLSQEATWLSKEPSISRNTGSPAAGWPNIQTASPLAKQPADQVEVNRVRATGLKQT